MWRCLAAFFGGCLVLLYLEMRQAQTEISVLRGQVAQVQALNVQIERLVARQQIDRLSKSEPQEEQAKQFGIRQKNETQSLRSVPTDLAAEQERIIVQGRAEEYQAGAAQRRSVDPPLLAGQFPPGILGQLLAKTPR